MGEGGSRRTATALGLVRKTPPGVNDRLPRGLPRLPAQLEPNVYTPH